MAGLARHEAARLLNRCWVDLKHLDPEWLRKAKAGRVSERLGGALSFIDPHGADIGGLESLKKWVAVGKKTFASEKAQKYGLPELKGLLFVGVPGCGKSAMVKAIARDYGMPCMRLDAGKLFGSLVGESESKTRQAIQAAEACAPCILWIDEIEKALGGRGEGPQGDSGVSTRMVGSLLTWLQEKTKPVFVIATANSVASLRPELLRKGRIDEIFFVDLPDCEEREAICKIHLSMEQRKGSIDGVKPGEMAGLTDGFSGAELEQAVIDAMRFAFSEDRKTTIADVKQAVEDTTPLSKTLADDIERIRKWAKGRARYAGKPRKPEPPDQPGSSPFMKRPTIQG
jgi:SpoVK/Ycf46/Vps4 family AAA+-type ATPase